MLSNPQKSLLKRAQRQAALSDDEYREALEVCTGFRSSRHPDFTNRQFDIVLAYFEAIYSRKMDTSALPQPGGRAAVFQQRGFWADKNTRQETSRDRFRGQSQGPNLGQAVAALESQLNELGFGQAYCHAIREKVAQGRRDERGQHLYCAALKRTLNAKKRQAKAALNPF